jgi:DNA-binding NarL/FixJ family response regulator
MDRALKVIVIEDDDHLRDLYAMCLSADPNIQTAVASTLIEGGQLARREPQVVILADPGLPDVQESADAINVLRRIVPGATIVVISGSAERKEAAIAAGADAGIVKGDPGSVGSELIETVRKAVITHDLNLMHAPLRASNERIEKILAQIHEPYEKMPALN